MRPGRDHPRRPARQGRQRRRPARPRPPPGRAAVRRARADGRRSRRSRASATCRADDHVLRMRVTGPITPVVRAAARYELLDFVSREPTPRGDVPRRSTAQRRRAGGRPTTGRHRAGTPACWRDDDPPSRSRSAVACTASGASTARRSGTRGSRSSSPPACSAGWRSSWAPPSRASFRRPASRLEVDKLIGSIPASMVNLFGKPEKLGTLGGYMSWKYGAIFALGTALWSILALSSHARQRGQPRQPRPRRRGAVRQAPDRAREAGRAPDDARARDGHPRARHDGQLERVRRRRPRRPDPAAVGARLRPVGRLHRPVLRRPGVRAGAAPRPRRRGGRRRHRDDRAVGGQRPRPRRTRSRRSARSAGPPTTSRSSASTTGPGWRWSAIVAAVFLAIGVELFTPTRSRGHGRPVAARACRPRVLGVRGPISRAFGDQLPRALAWGIGLGLMGALLASLVGPMADQIAASADLLKVFSSIFPDFDLGVGRRLPPAVRAAVLHRGRVRGRDARLEMGVGRDRRPARDGPRDAPAPCPLGHRRRRSPRSSASS